MGFDIECIIDIHTYPGEFFCPVCRTLVYPNEALQSQCTHLYCKPCLAHVANGSRACPYDGYLVTESDSKPLIESDKALADKIGKVKVHCLYHRSGCTWEGPLSECTSHCSGCTFGNSPVICNRCGVQIVHRQVHDHAQSCPGVYQTQQTAEGVQGASSSGPASATTAADSNQTAAQPGAATSQTQNPQSTAAPLLPGQDLNQQADPNFQAPTVVTTGVPTPEQWYQQQYQQYYQQYAGYDPHQQPYHQYYPPQQQPLQQYQQNSLQMQGQLQSQTYAQPQQPQPPVQSQPQVQPQLHPQTQQPQPQPQPQPNGQPQHQSQPQPPLQPQTHSQSQVPPQGQPQMHAPVRAPAPGHQVNPLQQLHPAMQSQAQVPTQALPPPPGQSAPQPPPYAHGQTHPQPLSMRPPVQQQQMPQYPQPQSQMYYTQASQVQNQQQMHLQPQLQPHLQTQPQPQPQAHLQHPPQSHPQLRPQLNQPTAPTAQPQALHLTAPAVTGHHSHPQPHPAQQMQTGALQQHPMHPYPTNGSLPPAHIHGQVSQQPAFMRPPHSLGQLPQQQASAVLPPQGQVSGIPPAQQQQFQPQAQQPVHQIQHMPVMQPVRQTMPQQPFLGPVQSQLHQHGHFVQQQQPPHPQVRMMQQNIAVPQSSLPQQSQNYVGRPMMANHVIQPQSFPQSSAGFGAAQLRPVQINLNQPSTNKNYARSVVLEGADDHVSKNHETVQGVGSPPENIFRKDSKVLGTDADVKSETVLNNVQKNIGEIVDESGQNRTVVQDADHKVDAAEDGAGSSLSSSDGKPVETATAEDKYATDNAQKDKIHSLVNHDSSQRIEPHEHRKLELQKATDSGLSSADLGKSSHTDGHLPRPQVQGHPQPMLKPKGSGLPQPGQSFNQIEHQSPLLKKPFDSPLSGIPDSGTNANFGRGPGQLGPRPGSFELHSAPQGPPPTVLAPGSVDPRGGIMGRAPPLGPEVHFGPHPVRSNEPERGPLGRPYGVEPIPSRMNTGAGPDSSKFGLHGEKFKALAGEYSNSFQMETTQHQDPAARPFDMHHPPAGGPPSRFLPLHHPPAGLLSNVGGERDFPVAYNGNNKGRVDPGRGHPDMFGPGPEFGRDHMNHFPPRSPDREYHSISSRGFGSISTFPHGPLRPQ
ncbi:RING-type domain-containing protein [Abeliophyllum distichum]|uniref:RING-type domain-containing protein n=1 Tax=Abeliophyllum distichum TaxID=126358 RepID=A0ABD1VWS1_9LAMI